MTEDDARRMADLEADNRRLRRLPYVVHLQDRLDALARAQAAADVSGVAPGDRLRIAQAD
ncbi:hypothetical protein [Brevundimonas naejangsanensis]|uniref:hypothetical protein n=1 Tax=Brevundimonas naejangsanensis TaxID=588932 RepID=UPI000EE6476E|nr:hypothetical protein [Brevundimonas naejangsanensis]HAC01528.1 hypothetical protein [Brevundimonas sp.]HCW50137.1 hypothetical protein [Brevundimonas sp.]